MATETIDHGTLSRLVEAGVVKGAHIVGQSGGWAGVVKYGLTERPLAAQRTRQVRLFRRFETLVSYLKDMGIARYEVDASALARIPASGRLLDASFFIYTTTPDGRRTFTERIDATTASLTAGRWLNNAQIANASPATAMMARIGLRRDNSMERLHFRACVAGTSLAF